MASTIPGASLHLANGDMLITEKRGGVRVFRNGALAPEPLPGGPRNIHNDGDSGLLDIVLDPDFTRNGTVFISFTERALVLVVLAQSRSSSLVAPLFSPAQMRAFASASRPFALPKSIGDQRSVIAHPPPGYGRLTKGEAREFGIDQFGADAVAEKGDATPARVLVGNWRALLMANCHAPIRRATRARDLRRSRRAPTAAPDR